MTPHSNETPEPLAGPSVESCATALAEALRREKGWLLDYADSVIRDAIDRKHLEPLAQEQAREYRSLYELSGCITDANTMLIGRYELKAKDAEIAGLKADAGRYRWIKADEGDGFRLIQIQFAAHHYDEKIDVAMKGEAA